LGKATILEPLGAIEALSYNYKAEPDRSARVVSAGEDLITVLSVFRIIFSQPSLLNPERDTLAKADNNVDYSTVRGTGYVPVARMRASKFYGQATKGARWMPWQKQAMKDVASCDKLRGAAHRL
jgi:hypothetical protein